MHKGLKAIGLYLQNNGYPVHTKGNDRTLGVVIPDKNQPRGARIRVIKTMRDAIELVKNESKAKV